MNPRKAGKLFIVLMISLIAFGFGSCANALNSGNDVTSGILPSMIASNNNEQISTIGDPSFEPAHLMKQYYNITNSTNSTPVNNTSNSTNSTKNSSRNTTWWN
ncbi:hypothetical protein [Methanobacterium sp. MBAC-LM]|uniref:hypothetical protein n=1 Tax=Methanobacterium sp. MBAC-LM TaxID=3412034 RepID=UPI003C72E9F6